MEIAERSVGVFSVRGEYFALRNTCPHPGGPLCKGLLTGFVESAVPGGYRYTRQGEILRYPWHGWEFEVKTGQSWIDPVCVRVSGDVEEGREGMQRGSCTAETYDVTVEESAGRQYVVMHVP